LRKPPAHTYIIRGYLNGSAKGYYTSLAFLLPLVALRLSTVALMSLGLVDLLFSLLALMLLGGTQNMVRVLQDKCSNVPRPEQNCHAK
jgi:hypothetical protein